ncbi:MAG: serine/threonine protein kinase [Polyangiaceae bacterium]|nr:serine/threonine protein kinase [Polyangiaceae bacterium]
MTKRAVCQTFGTLNQPGTNQHPRSQGEPSLADGQVRAGLILGRYELLVPIAAGGMAQVWAARMKGARQFKKLVAVKTMLPKLSEDEHFEQMFLDEASLASQIRHPNAVEILDLGEQEGILYLVMEWIEGVPLNQLLKAAKKQGGIPIPYATRIVMNACAGLHAAHELVDEKGNHVGLVHRDVSPQNILVTYDGVTKVVDFGVAKATALGGGATVAGQIKGKVSYMAPEQVNGEGLDRRADVFALGIVLYALTTGKHPFRKESEAATMYNICSPHKVTPPSKVVPDYPSALEPVLLKALEKDRDLRYNSCDEMLRALDALPGHLRIGSDSDVGQYLRGLLGDKRVEQKSRIDVAIQEANQAAEEGVWPANKGATPNRASLTSMSGQELSQIQTGIHGLARNRIFGILGLGALAVAGGVLATVMIKGNQKTTEIRVIEKVAEPQVVGTAPSAADKTTTPSEAPGVGPNEDEGEDQNGEKRRTASFEELAAEKEAEEEALQREQLVEEKRQERIVKDKRAEAEKKKREKTKATGAATPGKVKSEKKAPSPPVKKDTPPSNNWKLDAGF